MLVVAGVVIAVINYGDLSLGNSSQENTTDGSVLRAVEIIWSNAAVLTLGSAAVAMGVVFTVYEVYSGFWFIGEACGKKIRPSIRRRIRSWIS